MPPPAHGAPARPPQIPAARDVTGRGGGREGGGGGGSVPMVVVNLRAAPRLPPSPSLTATPTRRNR